MDVIHSIKKNKRCLSILPLIVYVATLSAQAQSFEEGWTQYFRRNYQKAESIFRNVTTQDPNHEKAFYFLGQSLIKLERIDEASAIYNQAITTNKKFSKSGLLIAGQGHIALLKKDSVGARAIFEDAITLTKGKDPEVLTAVGYANLEPKGNLKYAVEVLTQATESPKFKNSKAYLFLGYAHKQLLDGSKSIQAFNAATRMNPKEAEAFFQAGKIFATQQNEEVFLKHYYDAINADPDFFQTYFEFAMYYFAKGQVDSTRKYLAIYSSKSKEAGEDAALLQTHEAALLFIDKKYEQSLSILDNIRPNMSKPTGEFVQRRIFRLQSLNYDAKKDYAKAIPAIQQYIQLAEKSKEGLEFSDMLLYLNMLLSSEDQTIKDTYFKAALDKSASLKKDPIVQNVILNKISELCNKLDYPRGAAEVKIKKLELSSSPTPSDYFEAGYACIRANMQEMAIPYLKQYVEKAPQEPLGHFWLGQANIAVDSTMETSHKNFETYIALASQKAEENKSGLVAAYKFMGMYTTKNKQYDDAIGWWDKVLAIDATDATATKVKASLLSYKKQMDDYKKKQEEYEKRKKEFTTTD